MSVVTAARGALASSATYSVVHFGGGGLYYEKKITICGNGIRGTKCLVTCLKRYFFLPNGSTREHWFHSQVNTSRLHK